MHFSPLSQLIGSIFLATIPALIWGAVFYQKRSEDKKLAAIVFFMGALCVFPIILYKFSWEYFPWLNAFRIADLFKNNFIGFSGFIVIPVSVIITFMMVGFLEEILKLFSIKIVDDEKIKTIDDSIEFFIIAALGFAFAENILYFYNIWSSQGLNNLIIPFIFRSSFSTFAHIIFSGILGYYYGIAHFAKPVLQNEIRQNRGHWTVFLHKIFNIKKEKLFYEEKLLEGLLIAVSLHALFNIILELNFTFLIVPFLICGYYVLDYLFLKKENHKNYQKLLIGQRNHPHPKSGVYFKQRAIQ